MQLKKYLKPGIFSKSSLFEPFADNSILSNFLEMPDEWNDLEGDEEFH